MPKDKPRENSLSAYVEKYVREHMAKDCVMVSHDSDCATHNMPAYLSGPCDCSAAKR